MLSPDLLPPGCHRRLNRPLPHIISELINCYPEGPRSPGRRRLVPRIQNFSGHRSSSPQLLSSSLSRIISSTSEGWAPKTSAGSPWPSPAPIAWGSWMALVPWAPFHHGHLMRRPPRWSGPQSPGCFYPASARALLAYHRSRRPGRHTRPWLPGAGPVRGRTGGW